MKRAIVVLLMLVFMFGIGIQSFAAAPVAGDSGNTVNLLAIKKPDTPVSGSTKNLCPLSGVSSNGVTVSVWKYNSQTGAYEQLCNADGKEFRVTVGASGLFYFNLPLSRGANQFAVRAEGMNGTYQNMFYTINLIDVGAIKSIFNEWFN